MRRALIVGIDQYPVPWPSLSGCIDDSRRIWELLKAHHDGSPNFECRLLQAPPARVDRATLSEAIEHLFADDPEVALFYFAGHGALTILGGFLVTQDGKAASPGFAMNDVIGAANLSRAREAVILLDCCHSGAMGELFGLATNQTALREGVSVLAGSRSSQTVVENESGGVFTQRLRAALEGGAADVLGKNTIASVYAYVDQSLGAWQQRPVFKANVSKLISLRNSSPIVDLAILRMLPKYFARATDVYGLDPSYEPDANPKNPEHE